MIGSLGLIILPASGAYVEFDNGKDKLLLNNKHIVNFQLNWGSENYPDGKITFDKSITDTILLQIPKNIPRITNLDFGSSLYAIQTDGSWEEIKETESNCFYILEIPVNDSDHIKIESASVATGRWEPVTIENEECNYMYNESPKDGSVFPRHGFHAWNILPLKQFKSGILIDEILCKEHLVLIQKYNGSPACVTPETREELIERGWAKNDSILKTSTNCMTLEQNKETAPFFKTPAYLPEGYSHVCSQSGTPSESYIVYHHKEILNWNIPELIGDDAIFIYQIDERNILGEEKLETLGTAERRIQETYDSVIESNPSLQPQLIRVNGMLAYAVDSCPDCGMQTANFADGTFILKSTSTETKIKFIDENGINYMLKTALPLDELILVAESLQ